MSTMFSVGEQSFLERVLGEDRNLYAARSWYGLEDAWSGLPTSRRREEIAFRVQTGIRILLGLRGLPEADVVRLDASLDQLGAVLRDHDDVRRYPGVYERVRVPYESVQE